MLAEFNVFTDREIVGRTTDAIEEHDVDSCRQLYLSMIELAVLDYRFLQKMSGQTQSSRYDRKKLRQMTEDGDPREFFASEWFEQVCDYVSIRPELIRERLAHEDERLDLARMAHVA